MHYDPAPAGQLLPARQVCTRYGVSDRTLDRWTEHREYMKFPDPIRINRRRYWRVDELVAWERTRAARAGAAA